MHCSKAYLELTSLPPPVLNVILTSMCLLSTYDHFSLRALSKGGAFLTHNKETTTTTKKFFLQNIPFLLNPLSTNTSLPFFMGERRRNHKLCFSVTSASYTKQKVIPINSAYFSVTNCMLIIIITYLYPVFKRIIQSCFSFYFSLTWTKLIEKR